MSAPEKLAILVPDGAYPLVLRALLTERRASLRIREVPHEIIKDAFRDSSREGAALLRPFLRTCSHALMIRDLEGSGWEKRGAAALEQDLLEGMRANGWPAGRAAVIVVDPEIEAWLRFDSPHLHQIVRDRARRRGRESDLLLAVKIDEAVAARGGLNDLGKPARPKEVLESILAHFGIQRGNAIYESLAKSESLKGCKVASFQRVIALFQAWFPDQP